MTVEKMVHINHFTSEQIKTKYHNLILDNIPVFCYQVFVSDSDQPYEVLIAPSYKKSCIYHCSRGFKVFTQCQDVAITMQSYLNLPLLNHLHFN